MADVETMVLDRFQKIRFLRVLNGNDGKQPIIAVFFIIFGGCSIK